MKQALLKVMEALTDLIGDWNDMAADGDRGRANNALALVIWDDGSGRVCTYWGGFEGKGEHLNTQIMFKDIDEAVESLMEWLD